VLSRTVLAWSDLLYPALAERNIPQTD
jgi:hypothetical protein